MIAGASMAAPLRGMTNATGRVPRGPSMPTTWLAATAGCVEHRFDLERIHEETRKPQHVAHARQKYVGIVCRRVTQVAALYKAIRSKCGRGCFSVAIIFTHHARHFEFELAVRAVRKYFSG